MADDAIAVIEAEEAGFDRGFDAGHIVGLIEGAYEAGKRTQFDKAQAGEQNEVMLAQRDEALAILEEQQRARA